MCSCSLENFKLWFNYGTQVKTDFIPHAEGSFYESNKKNKKELLVNLKALEEQIEAKELEKEKLLNPEKEQKESINKKI